MSNVITNENGDAIHRDSEITAFISTEGVTDAAAENNLESIIAVFSSLLTSPDNAAYAVLWARACYLNCASGFMPIDGADHFSNFSAFLEKRADALAPGLLDGARGVFTCDPWERLAGTKGGASNGEGEEGEGYDPHGDLSLLFPFMHLTQTGGWRKDDAAFKNWLLSNFNVRRLNGSPSYYDGKGYIMGASNLTKLIERIYQLAGMNTVGLDEMVKHFSMTSRNFSDPMLICVGNGIIKIPADFNPEHIELLPHTPRLFLTQYTTAEWHPDIMARAPQSCAAVDDAFTGWSSSESGPDPEVEQALFETFALGIFNSMKWKKASILYGKKNSGKSSLLGLIAGFFGEDNTVNLSSLEELADRFSTMRTANAAIAIADELADGWLSPKNAAPIKKFISGERTSGEEKFQARCEYSPRAKLICGCNDIPRIEDPALRGRFKLIPMLNRFDGSRTSNNNANSNRGKDLAKDPDALSYVLFRAVRVLCAMLKRESEGKDPFAPCHAADQLMREYSLEADPYLRYVHSQGATSAQQRAFFLMADQGVSKTLPALLEDFCKWYATQPDFSEKEKPTQAKLKRAVLDMHPELAVAKRAFDYVDKSTGRAKSEYLSFFTWKHPGTGVHEGGPDYGA